MWVPAMDKYSGQTAEITDIDWAPPNPDNQISLSVDDGQHIWSSRCFVSGI
jgi:hypothetical protein